MSDDDTEDQYHGHVYFDAVQTIATFIGHRVHAGDGVTAERLLEVFCQHVQNELAAPDSTDG
jgi:hypothetical protein